jgi:hypothetical protein
MYQLLSAGIVICLLGLLACTPKEESHDTATNSEPKQQTLAVKYKSYPPEPLSSIDTSFNDGPLQLRYHHMPWPQTAAMKNMLSTLKEQLLRIAEFCGEDTARIGLPCNFYPSIEAKGLALENTHPCQADIPSKNCAIVVNEVFQTFETGPQNALLLRRYLGQPDLLLLEKGLSIYFNTHWQKKGYNFWAGRMTRSGNLPSIEELISNQYWETASPLVSHTAAASLVSFLVEEWGTAAFLQKYKSWQPSLEEARQIEKGWHHFLKKTAETTAPEDEKLTYLKGFNFAHEGYSIYNGYGSALSASALHEQAVMGANAIALVPYSYLRNPQKPSHFPFMSRAGTETDESLIVDFYHCNHLGMSTVLKPQVWLGHNSWPGAVEMTTEADWQEFFDFYYQWMRHYALLAAIHEVDLLCIGVEFAQTTLQRPEDWKALIRKIRGIYYGPLTYAANWGEEFEQLSFWSELDYIGLNCYYPLSKKEAPTEENLSAAFDKILNKASDISKAYGRPLIFTEIGFTSTPTPWVQPHVDGRGEAYSSTGQQACYKIVMEALQEQESWCRGILWWKYPSYMRKKPTAHTGFTPKGKPAEEVLKAYFPRLP